MIHFRIKDLDSIEPIGQAPGSLSWFSLTDGDLWFTFGSHTLYEYSMESMAYFKDKPTPFNDYYIVRFIEDFSELFRHITTSISKGLYRLTEDLELFKAQTEKWNDIYDTDPEDINDFYAEEYQIITSWFYERELSAKHLMGGPRIYFFRCGNKIRIVWETHQKLENGSLLWTAKNAWYEMDFSLFISEVRSFADAFFRGMDLQVENAVKKDWGNLSLDKEVLIKEHAERKAEFYRKFKFLEDSGNDIEYDWQTIEILHERMLREI